jgi:hypothetical protein
LNPDPIRILSEQVVTYAPRFDDPEVKKDMSMVSYKIVKASNGDAWVKSTDGKVRPNDM